MNLNSSMHAGNKSSLAARCHTFSCVGCGCCDSSPVRPYRANTCPGQSLFGRAWLHECAQCGLVQIFPLPTPGKLNEYYTSDYRSGYLYGIDVANVEKFPNDNLFYLNRGRSIADLLVPHVQQSGPQTLDVGAGYGHVLYGLREKFPQADCSAIEFSDVCVTHLKSLSFQVHSCTADQLLSQTEQFFDLVTLSHVLEHLLDPRTVLELIHARLAPGGVLYIEVPNIPSDSLLRYPDHVWAPRYDEPHITFFSMRTLQNLLETAGFEVRFFDTAGPNYKYISRLRFQRTSIRWSLQGLLPAPVFHWLRRQSFTAPLRLKEREESFYQYGGVRIWIRSVSCKKQEPAK